MYFNYRSVRLSEVKLIALILSFIMIINDAMAGVMVVKARLEIEKNLSKGLKIWNQSKDFEQLVKLLPLSKVDKLYLITKINKEKLNKVKPPSVDFISAEKKLILHQRRSNVSLWILEFVPNIIIYDSQIVQEFQPKLKIQDIFNESTGDKQLKLKSIKRKKNVLINWLLPDAQAQFLMDLTTEQKVAIEAQQKAEAARQTKLAKSILLVTLFSFLGFLSIGFLWSKFSGPTPSVAEAESTAKNEADKKIAELHFPEIKHELFDVEEPLISMICEKDDQGSRLKQIIFQGKSGSKSEYDFSGDNNRMQEMMDKQDSLGKKLYNADFCCQHYPCKKWLDLKPIDNSVPLKKGVNENQKNPDIQGQIINPEVPVFPVSETLEESANK